MSAIDDGARHAAEAETKLEYLAQSGEAALAHAMLSVAAEVRALRETFDTAVYELQVSRRR